jgi:bifunctional non-homologous end joining protein LigD
MSCEAHRQQALTAILAAHPGKGLSPADAERIYQKHRQAHPSLSYETLTQLAGVAAQSGGAVSLEETVEMYDTARGTVAIDRERLKDARSVGGDDLVMADLNDGEPPVSNAQPKPVAMKRGAELARDLSAHAEPQSPSLSAGAGGDFMSLNDLSPDERARFEAAVTQPMMARLAAASNRFAQLGQPDVAAQAEKLRDNLAATVLPVQQDRTAREAELQSTALTDGERQSLREAEPEISAYLALSQSQVELNAAETRKMNKLREKFQQMPADSVLGAALKKIIHARDRALSEAQNRALDELVESFSSPAPSSDVATSMAAKKSAKPKKEQKIEPTKQVALSSDSAALDSFAAPYRAKFKKPEASILSRWKTRVLPAGLHTQGEAGAAAYLERYGKGIATPKVVALALCAEHEGASEMAKGFWKKAYQLQTGVTLASRVRVPAELPSTKITGPTTAPKISLPEFPDTLQPGYFDTMQAVNPHFNKKGELANKSISAIPTPAEVVQARELLIADNDYWAQPKRDGERRAAWAGKKQNAYQARSANVRGAASPEIDAALQAAAKKFGPCTLDGEVYYPDVKGGEHRTASQAYDENVKLGHPEAPTPARYAIFTALYANSKDLRDGTQKARVEAGEKIGNWLEKKYPGVIELVPTARARKEKAALCAKQKAEGREGEVWVKKDCAYRGGKQRGGDILRTKYRQELDVVVMGLTHTSADKRGFGALSVGVYGADGKLRSLGEIGTGYNEDEQMEILRRVMAGEKIVVTVSTQGRTESGQLWSAVFKDIRTDKAPEECVE